jgi:hypothetical protein
MCVHVERGWLLYRKCFNMCEAGIIGCHSNLIGSWDEPFMGKELGFGVLAHFCGVG